MLRFKTLLSPQALFADGCAKALSKLVLSADKPNLPRASLERFLKLSEYERYSFLKEAGEMSSSDLFAGVTVVSLRDEAAIKEVFHKPYRKKFEDLRKKLLDDVDAEEIEQSDFGVIEATEITNAYIVIADDTKEILGASGSVMKQGYQRQDTNLDYSYRTVKAAEKAGADMGDDINWQGSIVIDHTGEVIGEARYEWTGW
jgi:hypothetical protein